MKESEVRWYTAESPYEGLDDVIQLASGYGDYQSLVYIVHGSISWKGQGVNGVKRGRRPVVGPAHFINSRAAAEEMQTPVLVTQIRSGGDYYYIVHQLKRVGINWYVAVYWKLPVSIGRQGAIPFQRVFAGRTVPCGN